MKVPFSQPDIRIADEKAVRRVFDSDWLSMGPETLTLEEEINQYLGCEWFMLTNSGTAAVLIAMLASESKRITLPSYCYHATLSMANLVGLKVSYEDISKRTVLMRPNKTRTLQMPISFAGLPLDPEKWESKNLIEDAGEAFGSAASGKKTGGQGWTTAFSFHAAKPMTMIQGGGVATDSWLIYKKLEEYRAKLNAKPTDIVSAIGRESLKRLPEALDNRQRIVDLYREELEGLVKFQKTPEYVDQHSNMMFPVFIDNPSQTAHRLDKLGIDTRLGWKTPRSVAALAIANTILCLPIYNNMRTEETEYVVNCLKKCL